MTASRGTAPGRDGSSAGELAELVHHGAAEALPGVAAAASLSEDLALALLKRRDLPAAALEELLRNPALGQNRRVLAGVAAHLRTPRHVVLPLLRQLFTFELMALAVDMAVAADVRQAAEQLLLQRLSKLTSGERLTLARRGSSRLAGALLLDPEPRIVAAALQNARLTEAGVVSAVAAATAPAHLFEQACRHARWSVRREVRIALLRAGKLPLARALEFARSLPRATLRDALHSSRLPASIKEYLQTELARRPSRRV